jgi:hypothetical protein
MRQDVEKASAIQLFEGSIKALCGRTSLLRLYQCSIKALLKLFEGSIKALCGRTWRRQAPSTSFKGLSRLY